MRTERDPGGACRYNPGCDRFASHGMFSILMAVLAATEGDLLARLQGRDPDALAELYDRYGAMAYRLILRIVRDKGIAEDLVKRRFCAPGIGWWASKQAAEPSVRGSSR